MTAAALALRLLARIGITSFDPAQNAGNVNRRGLCTGDLAETLAAINGAMEECFSLGPVALNFDRSAAVLRPPATVTLTATQYSATISALATWDAAMVGCTIRIDGDSRDNEIRSQTTLLRPYMGTSGSSISATVFYDCVALPSTVLQVIPPVEIPQQTPLIVCGSRMEFDNFCVFGTTNGFTPISRNVLLSQVKPVGMPIACYCDTSYGIAAASGYVQKFLRVSPMPQQAISLSYAYRCKPPAYVQNDLYLTTVYGTDPNTIIPFDWVESTLLPIALQRFSSHVAFDQAQTPEIHRQAEVAKKIFIESSKPIVARSKAIYC